MTYITCKSSDNLILIGSEEEVEYTIEKSKKYVKLIKIHPNVIWCRL